MADKADIKERRKIARSLVKTISCDGYFNNEADRKDLELAITLALFKYGVSRTDKLLTLLNDYLDVVSQNKKTFPKGYLERIRDVVNGEKMVRSF